MGRKLPLDECVVVGCVACAEVVVVTVMCVDTMGWEGI